MMTKKARLVRELTQEKNKRKQERRKRLFIFISEHSNFAWVVNEQKTNSLLKVNED
jgi:hypothetical protein